MGSTKFRSTKKKTNIKDYVSWFEIPAHNLERAIRFYCKIYDIEMEIIGANNYSMALFPTSKGIGGAVVSGEGCTPGDSGPLLYMNGGNDLNEVLGKVEEAGGRVVMAKTLIDEDAGFFAIFIDTEGNKLALYSKK